MKYLKEFEDYNIKSTTGNNIIAYFETGQGSKYLITEKNIVKLATSGVNEVVMHHGLFDTHDPVETIKRLILLLETSHL